MRKKQRGYTWGREICGPGGYEEHFVANADGDIQIVIVPKNKFQAKETNPETKPSGYTYRLSKLTLGVEFGWFPTLRAAKQAAVKHYRRLVDLV
jgi:hypothetical protein